MASIEGDLFGQEQVLRGIGVGNDLAEKAVSGLPLDEVAQDFGHRLHFAVVVDGGLSIKGD